MLSPLSARKSDNYRYRDSLKCDNFWKRAIKKEELISKRMQRGLWVITLQGATEKSPILLSKFEWLDGTIIISYFDASNNINADCIYLSYNSEEKSKSLLTCRKTKIWWKHEVAHFKRYNFQREGITTLRIYQYWIIHNTVIKTCFEMLKFSERKKFWRYSNYKSPNFKDCSEVRSADPLILYYY